MRASRSAASVRFPGTRTKPDGCSWARRRNARASNARRTPRSRRRKRQRTTRSLRTQQVLAYETGVTAVADPLGGSYYVEALTDEIEKQAEAYFKQIEEFGGVVEAIEAGFFQREIAEASYRYQRSLETKDRIVVGVNAFVKPAEAAPLDLLKIGAEIERGQARSVQAVRESRDGTKVESALAALKRACADPSINVMPPLIDAVNAYATEGEIVEAMVSVYGRYVERAAF